MTTADPRKDLPPIDWVSANASAAALDPDSRRELLAECLETFADGLRTPALTCAETATDLFEQNKVDEQDELEFMTRRVEWVTRFEEKLRELAERRFAGHRRKGRRPDPDVSMNTLRVLNPFDQEKQAAIAQAVRVLARWSRKELDALDLRIALLLDEPVVRDLDNPFGPDYVVDAIGASTRGMFPNPRVWRPFMERVLTDITPSVPKAYITLNRLLADRGVLPDIKAALRARSELRPADDKDLFPVFTRLLEEAGADVEEIDVEVPPIVPGFAAEDAPPSAASAGPTDAGGSEGPLLDLPLPAQGAIEGHAPLPVVEDAAGTNGPHVPRAPLLQAAAMPNAAPVNPASPQTRAAVQAAAAAWPASAPPPPRQASSEDSAFPSLDPLLTLGSSSTVFEVLAQWQSFDPQNQATQEALSARGVDTAALPLNRIPYIRVAMGADAMSTSEKITMDVIALLFDYIFRDPSIPDSTRGIFGRLQVPILKAALLDRAFFSDRQHPARRVLDRLASGAVGAGSNKAYRVAFEGVASRIVDQICREFVLDVDVFDRADRELVAFLETEHRRVSTAIGDDIEAALEAEAQENDRAHARRLIRDRLAGLRIPGDVRLFAETAWADYLTALRREHGERDDAYRDALKTMDDLLWSITAKERAAQKARLTRMVPGIIAKLRKGCVAVGVPQERARSFFDTLYHLHIEAIKPRQARTAPPGPPVAQRAAASAVRPPAGDTSRAAEARGGNPGGAARPSAEPASVTRDELAAVDTGGFRGTDNYHDYVSEMAVGTWLAFQSDGEWVNARLTWVSPLRTKYIFTSRFRSSAFVFAPEELAWELSVGRARVVLEPVPLFDRAVSAALNSLAARRPAPAQ